MTGVIKGSEGGKLAKVAAYLRVIARAPSLDDAQREARLALRLIEDDEK